MVRNKSMQYAATFNGTSAFGYIESRGDELMVRNENMQYASTLSGNTDRPETPRYVYDACFVCCSIEVDLIGNIAETSSWKLGYVHHSPTSNTRYGCVCSMWAGNNPLIPSEVFLIASKKNAQSPSSLLLFSPPPLVLTTPP